ncbi:thioredoxin family protein [Bradyrhizobium sp. 141]|uniref:thioredoxin family protein n=1 Tax=Bradyrhizobium sp. 141 TaxID=2782617 RepID=UPI001FFA5C09|nr:thioredoxin family protein [Bradyrhizobium sp. 141]MCK1719518.1 thioredoxin family protein [Bradyrhizobium sp. 141]
MMQISRAPHSAYSRRDVLRGGSALLASWLDAPGAAARIRAAVTKIGPVRSIDEFVRARQQASLSHRVTVVDVGADWCEFCETLDRTIFPDPTVSRLMNSLALIKVDVTAMDDANRELLGYLSVDGPPTVFVMDIESGREMPATRSVGAFEAADLARRLQPFSSVSAP